MGCGSRAWCALMRRNLLYRRTYWFSTILEIVLPPIFVVFLVLIKNAVDNTGALDSEIVNATFPDFGITPITFADYVTAMRAKKVCVPESGYVGAVGIRDSAKNDNLFDISGILLDGWDWQVPFVKCDSRICDFVGQDALPFCEFAIMAVSGSDEGGILRAQQFIDYVYETYPSVRPGSGQLPFAHDLIQFFNSSSDIDSYVKDSSYGRVDRPKIAMGIVFDGNDPKMYNYTLRQNSTNFNAPEDEARPAAQTTPPTTKKVNSFVRKDADSCIPIDGAPYLGTFGTSCTGQYLYNGIIPIQRLVHDFFLDVSGATSTGYSVGEAAVQFAPFPTKEYEEEGFYATIGEFAPLLITLGLLYSVSTMISYICKEKELRQKELMKMMSVTESDVGGSWFCTFIIVNFIAATFSAIFSASLFGNSDGLLLWIFWLLTMTSLTCFCMAIASITSKSIRGVLIGLLSTFGHVFIALATDATTANIGTTQLVSLLPVTAFSYGIVQICLLEDRAIGATFDSIGLSDNVSGYSLQNTIAMLMFDCVFWGVTSWYLNRVIKPDYGQALPFYFPLSKNYWFPESVHAPVSTTSVTEKVNQTGIPYEPVSDTLERQADEGKSIEIHNLRKTFGEKSAVDGLNLSIYSGQITALLGHNGAGKTTTINMLTGAMEPSEGYATIAGNDIRTNLRDIRQDIGICLQHDCLFPDLTVRQHVYFFARLKGIFNKMTKAEAEEHIDQAIRDVALFEKRNTQSKRLSGGQKRKLSVAIAFCGGSKVVLLDEPTSGMDPFSRRFTWNVIRQYRQDRCIILTTHFMDEADILGDRIAIMAEGQLRCAGSSLFLKKMYGVGYQLTVEKLPVNRGKMAFVEDAINDQSSEVFADEVVKNLSNKQGYDVDEWEAPDETEKSLVDVDTYSVTLNKMIKNTVPEATLLNNVGTEIKYQLPLGSSEKFPAMFEQLDKEIDRGKIVSYGVSITTLEEVFLLVARGDSTPESKTKLASSRILEGNKMNVIEEGDEKSVRSRMDLENEKLFGRHLNALFKKRALNFQRDKKAWLCTTILPVLVTLWGFILFAVTSPERDLAPITLDLAALNPDVTSSPINPIQVNSPENTYVCQPGLCAYISGAVEELGDQNQIVPPIIVDNVTYEVYGFCGVQGNLGFSLDGYTLGGQECTIDLSTQILSTINDFAGVTVTESNADSVLSSSQNLFATSDDFAATQYGAIWYTHGPNSTIVSNNSSNFVESVRSQCALLSTDGLNYTTPEDCPRFGGYGYVIQYNFTAIHAAPTFQALADQALLRYATGDLDITITTTIAPLPITALEEGYGAAEDVLVVWFLIMFAFPFITAAFASFVVMERESKAKHLQTVAGVEPTAYWISTYLWDTMNYQIPLWIIVALMFIFKVEALTTTDRNTLSGVIAALFFYGPASAGFAYCISFGFSSPSLCFVVLVVFSIIIGFGGPLTIFILYLIGNDIANPKPNLVDIANILTWILRLVPSFCLGKGLFFPINSDAIAFIEGKPGDQLSAWSEPILLVDVIFLIAESVCYLALAVYLDKWSSNPRIMSYWNSFFGVICCSGRSRGPDITTALPEDEDVLAEQDRVLSGGANSDLIVLSQLSKIYGNGKIAVNNLSLGIPHGECFGLLGINGAGKTTTMQMLTAEFPPTSGDATLAGFSISREPQKTRRRIGYCPQFDAHFAQLTGRNHVELYASIKGIPQQFVKEAAASKLKEVGLNDYDSDRLCVHYSGGMKRRLSLACATIGQPQIVFLDECSTGVDPVARREIWQMVSDLVSTGRDEEKASVILTTHSMEECEALCPRIGIMANGRLRCLGSAQHLKNKFGQGYQIELKTKIADRNDEDFVYNASVLCAKFANTDIDVEETKNEVSFKEEECKAALFQLTNDDFLSSMVSSDAHSVGYGIWKDATTPAGVALDALAVFATTELRMRKIATFVTDRFPVHVLRERQDTKARYEVNAEGLRISSIFTAIESMKDELRLEDYGVSQTSLEQVFNMHAAEAEKLKQGRDDH